MGNAILGEKSKMHLQYKPLKIVLIGRGHAAKHCFATLANSNYSRGCHFSGVVTDIINPRNKVVCYTVYNFAKHLDVKVLSEDINSEEGLKWLDNIKPDLGIMFGYPRKLSKEVIDRFDKYILNIHPSDLPKHRGTFPLHQQIIQNHPLVITVHKVDPRLDAGPWIYKTSPLDLSYLTCEEVYGLVKQQATLAILKVIEKILNDPDNLQFYEQDELSVSYATEAVTGKSLKKIDWQNDIAYICKVIQAVGIRTGISTSLLTSSGKKFEAKIHGGYEIYQKHAHHLGQVISYENGSYKVAAKQGFIIIEDLRSSEGKPLLPSALNLDKIENLFFI